MTCPQCPHCRAVQEEGLCESPVELAFLRELRKDNMFAAFVPNVAVMSGRYRIDFADVHSLIGVEIDGHAFHSDKQTFVKDRQRQRELELAGWRLIRFAAAEVMADIELCGVQFRDWLRAVRLTPLPIQPTTGRARLGGRAQRSAS